ncbi:Lrp/AsnC family transcriptional regulator [Ruegeria pomeroyi]|uniref:Lrp/AsnC family transcriptional regulator n=1 Tax=Ruegeria pomeroyi TaxID=89184 RepID=A0A9Q3WIZ3_9RHOB|nr:Lrp/AsnC family transcriptional regulator [Ruegeria pomeroyi]MCE8536302.1 Lrp/AsnC family transcriptional regulator [Ruegeria pomeroyi]
MDSLDKKILSVLQQNGQISMSALSERIGLSLSACHRRVKLMEAEGIIRNYAAQIDRQTVGLEVQVFIEVKLNSQRREDLEAFEKAILSMPEILECHMITGEFDFLIRVCVHSPADYEALYRSSLSAIPAVSQMKTLLSLSTVKEFRGYHLR